MGRPLPTGLDTALDDSLVEPALRNLARDHLGAATRVHGISAELLRRRVVRYTLEVDRPGLAQTAPWRVIGKVYESPATGQAGFAALRWLWERGFPWSSPERVALPQAFAFVPELQVLLMEEVKGQSLKQLLKSRRARPEHMRLFAEALVKLHRFPAVFGKPFTLDDHIEKRCAGLPVALARALPELAEPIERIVDTARRTQGSERCTLVHGDFHPGQVHVEGGRIWLLDLDPLNHGDPAYDVAMVFVALKRLESEKGSEYVRSMRDPFLATYFSRMDLRIAERVPLNAALIHLKRACKRFRWQDEPGWEDAVRLEILRGAENLALLQDAQPLHDLDAVGRLYDRCPGAA